MKLMINLLLVIALTHFTYQLNAIDKYSGVPSDQEEEMMEEESNINKKQNIVVLVFLLIFCIVSKLIKG